MTPLIVAISLSLVSLAFSFFVLFRIIVPILPPSPLSRKVSPAEFGLPTFKSLSLADKCHISLALLDILALAMVVWQVVAESAGATLGSDTASTVRVWIALTTRPTALLIILAITLLHLRLGRSISFGSKQWMLWAPTFVFTLASTAITGVLAASGYTSLWIGLLSYCSVIAGISCILICCVVGTLIAIKRNLGYVDEPQDEAWPPVRQMEEKPRPSFATEEVDAIRDGASWITSNASTRRDSVSAWSFSTHRTHAASIHGGRPQAGTHPSVPAKSSYWFRASTPDPSSVPPVPPLPSPSAVDLRDEDPFKREMPSSKQTHLGEHLGDHPRQRLGSQTSWLTSEGTGPCASEWSFPTTHGNASFANAAEQLLSTTAVSRPVTPITPAMASAQVLGGYGFTDGGDADKDLSLQARSGADIQISISRAFIWLVSILVPLGFSVSYLYTAIHAGPTTSVPPVILLTLSIALSPPLLAMNILLHSPLPVPAGLFDLHDGLPQNMTKRLGSTSTVRCSHEYKRSMSCTTVVEGRRSGDVWIANGLAIDKQSKLDRAFGMMAPKPKLSVLPPKESDDEASPPIPIQDESSLPITIHNTPRSQNSVQFGRIRHDSKASSRYSAAEEFSHTTKILVAQKHYSAVAQTFKVSSSPPKRNSDGTNVVHAVASGHRASLSHGGHVRSRSVSTLTGPKTPVTDGSFDKVSPPPSFPLPPTPPNVRAARLAQLKHKKSFSSGFTFGPVNDMNEIDALTAGVLPLLVPGLKVGDNMKIRKDAHHSPSSFTKTRVKKADRLKKLKEFGGDFSSPEIHSTPAKTRAREPRSRKNSAYKHFSLPSLGLGKDGIHSLTSWTAEVGKAIENKASQFMSTPRNVDLGYRNTVFGDISSPILATQLNVVQEHIAPDQPVETTVNRGLSNRRLGLHAEVPHGIDTARSSLVSLPPSTSTTTFVDFEAGLDSGPQAESTPHNTVGRKKLSHEPPSSLMSKGRSSIVYVKSSDPPASSIRTSISSDRGSRGVRLVPKAKKTPPSNNSDVSKSGSQSSGLRPLSLLQSLDVNVDNKSAQSGEHNGFKTTGSKRTSVTRPGNENARPNKNFKQLQLNRSETSKERAILRKGEVLPNVVVRPPSHGDHNGYTHTFSA